MPISTMNGKYIYNGVAYNTLQEAKAAEMRDSSMTINPSIPAGNGTPVPPVPTPQVRQPMSDQSMGAALNMMRKQGGLNAMDDARTGVNKQYSGRGEVGMPAKPVKPAGLLDAATPQIGATQAQPSFMDRLTSKEGLGGIGSMMLAMSNNPNLAKLGQMGMAQMQEKRAGNRTLEFLKSKGVDDETIAALRDNPQMINAYASSLLKTPKTYADQENYKLAKAQGFKGSFMDYQTQMNLAKAGVAGDKDFWKQYRGDEAKAIMESAVQTPELKNALGQIQTLRLLGDRMDESTMVPAFLRGAVPEGIDNSLDAYRSMLYSVAQSLRVAGTGPMTDKDFEILMKRAGSEKLGANERSIIQSGLEAAAQMRLDLAMAASEFRKDPSDESLAAYREKEAEILNRPLFSDEQRSLLGVDQESIDKRTANLPVGFVESLQPWQRKAIESGTMKDSDIQIAIDEWKQANR